MAVLKVVNKSTKSHGAMRNVIEYVLRESKIKDGFVDISGPYSGENITADGVYQSFKNEKALWDKDSGRMYAHYIISYHENENISPEKCLELGKELAEKFFPDHQYLISVHQDKGHMHCHIVVNSVSFIDGSKLHQTKHDLQHMKDYNDRLCFEHGLRITQKGYHFDGTRMEQGEITAWSKDMYNILKNDPKRSYVADCAMALMEVIPKSLNREGFISGMAEKGWSVQWEDSRKHITFKNSNGEKVRDSRIEKTFSGMEVNKEALIHEFEKHNEINRIASGGLDCEAAVRNDTEAFIEDLNAGERASEEKRDHNISQRAYREAERSRLNLKRERELETAEQRIAAESRCRISRGFER